jgi:hypothetical protein
VHENTWKRGIIIIIIIIIIFQGEHLNLATPIPKASALSQCLFAKKKKNGRE